MKHIRVLTLVPALILFSALAAGCISATPAEKTAVPTLSPAENTGAATADTIQPDRVSQPHTVSGTAAVPPGSIRKTFTYTLNGDGGTIPLDLPQSVYEEYTRKAEPAYKSNSSYFLGYIDDPAQQEYIAALGDAIRAKTQNTDDQARIAVSLVQHIPYHDGNQYRYPYEVLYKGQGVCGEKAMLLALLLKDLGYGSAVFYFVKDDHMTAAIKAASPYDFRRTGYAFIEATEPNIITDFATDTFGFGKLTGNPEVTPVGTGKALGGIAEDYQDAQRYDALSAKVKSLTAEEKKEWESLTAKYDLGYFTCETCKVPVNP